MGTGRTGAAVGVFTLTLVAATVSWASSFTVSAGRLGAATVAVPVFYPSSLATTNGKSSATGAPGRYDTVTIGYSRPLKVSTLCTGAAQANVTYSGVTLTLTNAGAASGNDTLSVTSGPAGCLTPHLGTVDLGSPAYLSGGTVLFTGSTMAVTLTSTSASIVLTLGTASGTVASVNTTTIERYAPDTALTDTSAHGIGANASASTSAVHF